MNLSLTVVSSHMTWECFSFCAWSAMEHWLQTQGCPRWHTCTSLESGHFSDEAGRLGYVTISTYKLSFLIPYIECSLTELVERIWLMIRSLHFSCSDYFINSHNFLPWLCIGMVGRKLILVEGKGYSVCKADQSVPCQSVKKMNFAGHSLSARMC